MKYILIVIGAFIVGLLSYMAFKPVPKTEVKVVPTYQPAQSYQAPVTTQPTQTQPKSTVTQSTTQPTQSASQQQAIDNLKNFETPTFAQPVIPETEPLPPQTDISKYNVGFTAPTPTPKTICQKVYKVSKFMCIQTPDCVCN